MSNGADNTGKPPTPGFPQITPAAGEVRTMPKVTSAAPIRPPNQPLPPVAPVITPAAARPGPLPVVPPPARSGTTPLPTGPALRPVVTAPRPALPVVTAPQPPRPVIAPPSFAPPRAPVIAPPLGAPRAPPALIPSAPVVVRPPPPAPRIAAPALNLFDEPEPPPAPPVAPPPPAAAPIAMAIAAPRTSPISATGAVETISDGQAAALRALAQNLNALDYFAVLGVVHAATPGDIKKAFYRESRTYHPDRFFHLLDSQVKTDLGSIYKRITESYYVLRDDAKRKKYQADISGADRANKLRYTEATESELKAEARKTVDEEFGNNPKSRPFFKSALADIERKNWASAERNLKMGLTYEAGNARFKEQLLDVQKKLDEQRRVSGEAFKIK